MSVAHPEISAEGCKLLQVLRIQNAVDASMLEALLDMLSSNTAVWREWPQSEPGIVRKVCVLEPESGVCSDAKHTASKDIADIEALLRPVAAKVIKAASQFFEVDEKSLWLAHQRIYVSAADTSSNADAEAPSDSDISLSPHVDETFFSYVVTLSTEFTGGGTFFVDSGQTYNSSSDSNWQAGDACIFGGGFREHYGQRVTWGSRLTLNGFIDFHPSRSEVDDLKQQGIENLSDTVIGIFDKFLDVGFRRSWSAPRLMYNMDKVCNLLENACSECLAQGMDASEESSLDVLDPRILWRIEDAFCDDSSPQNLQELLDLVMKLRQEEEGTRINV